MSAFLTDAWYVAAWCNDVGRAPFARTLLNQPVVLYRRENGEITALADRCPHRFVPLSRGKVHGDEIACGYHGLRFSSSGQCVDLRFGEKLRQSAGLRRYPTVERHGAIWIWMGDPVRADACTIPDFSCLTRPGWEVIRGTTHVKAHYSLEVDNLMDLSHLDYVHRGGIGNGTLSKGHYSSRQDGRAVHSDWWSPAGECPQQFAPYFPNDAVVDQWNEMRWEAPGLVYLYNGVTKCGQPKQEGYEVFQGHFLTPESEQATFYLWAVARKDMGEPPEVAQMIQEMIRRTFEDEDRPMLEAQQRAMGNTDFWGQKPVSFAEDAGAIRARRVMDELIAEEQRARAQGGA